MTQKELEQWWKLLQGEIVCKNLGLNPPEDEHQELTRLNFLVMELAHKIHNDNMLQKER